MDFSVVGKPEGWVGVVLKIRKTLTGKALVQQTFKSSLRENLDETGKEKRVRIGGESVCVRKERFGRQHYSTVSKVSVGTLPRVEMNGGGAGLLNVSHTHQL